MVNFNGTEGQTKEVWATLERPNKKGMQVNAGEISVQFRFVPNLEPTTAPKEEFVII